jgi:hypothetical protein
MRETLEQAAKKLLTQAVGTEDAITININDGLTGFAPGVSSRGARTRTTKVRVDVQTRPDGKKRHVVVAQLKGTVVASGSWE